jgi:hypothetical protein
MEKMTADEADTLLRQYFRRRSDLGLWKAIQAKFLQPQSPFESRSVRMPQRWFVLFLIVSTVLMAAFIYFNLWS